MRVGEGNGWPLALVAVLALVVLLCIPALRRADGLYLFVFGVMLAALGTYLFYMQTVLPFSALDGETVPVTARVHTVEQGENPHYILSVTEDGVLKKGTRLSVVEIIAPVVAVVGLPEAL